MIGTGNRALCKDGGQGSKSQFAGAQTLPGGSVV